MKVIQVGVGGFGRCWLERMATARDVELVAAVDVADEPLQSVAQFAPAARCFTSVREAFDTVQADALLCVTPPRTHKEICVAAMKRGLDVLMEKPLAESVSDCRAVLRTARTTGKLCTVSQQYRKHPEMVTLKRAIEKGLIGEIGQVSVQFHMFCNFGPDNFRSKMPYPVLVDMAIHHFDLIRFLTDREPESVLGAAWNPAWSPNQGDTSSSLVFKMQGGVAAEYSSSWCAHAEPCDWNGNWRIEGDRGTLMYANGVVRLLRFSGGKCTGNRIVPTVKPRYAGQDGILHDFMKGVSSRERTETDVTDNIKSMSMVFGAVKAVETGRTVRLGG